MIGFKHARQVNSFLDLNGPTLSTLKSIGSESGTESTITISPALPDGTTTIDLETIGDFSNFESSKIYTMVSNGNFLMTVTLQGAAGGPGDVAENFGEGGKGGNVTGTVSFEKGQSYTLVIGSKGTHNGGAGAVGGGAASGGSDNSQTSPTKGGAGGSGGGYTGLFKGTVSQANALLIAGGGGGGSFETDPDDDGGFNPDRKADGGDGGGLQGGFVNPTDRNVSNTSLSGTGGTQLSAGSGGKSIEGGQGVYAGSNGSALQGGAGSPYNDTGGGGGGYFGGGGGGYQASTINGSGGGGSGFISVTNIVNGFFEKASNTGGGRVTVFGTSYENRSKILTGIATALFPSGQTKRNTNTGELKYQWYEEGVGPLSESTNLVGTATTTLTINNTLFADNGRKFFLRANYENSAYFQTGIAKSTANAINEPFDSGLFTLSIPPRIEIKSQPVSQTTITNNNATFEITASIQDGSNEKLVFDWQFNGQSLGGSSFSNLTRSVSQEVVSDGVKSTLVIRNSNASFDKISCVVTHIDARPQKISSTEVNFDVSVGRALLKFERYSQGVVTVEAEERDIAKMGGLSFRADANRNARIICVWAAEEDVEVKVTVGGAAGINRNGNRGGTGGISVFKTTLIRNEEYIIKLGVNDQQGGGPRGGNNGGGGICGIYHKAKMIAVAGGGGGAGTNGRGGDGGGLQVAGEDGQGSSSGRGGVVIQQGELPTTGLTQAGRTGLRDFDNDSSGSGRIGGCTVGAVYWIARFAHCADIGQSKMNNTDGSTISDSTTLLRGYKPGQGWRNNGGAASGNQGGGGAGARGGTGATNNGSGGGGASGYASDEVEILSSSVLPTGTQLGGNDDVAFICFEVYSENLDPTPCIPPKSNSSNGLRTVRFSVSRNAGDSNTVTFTRQSGTGPDTLTFGPNGGTVSAQIARNAVYTRTSSTASGGRGLSFRLSGNTLQLDDNLDSDFNDLEVTPDGGSFTSDSRYVS
tara:strand:+ start:2863 stop:5802 length:2940 start_codon:yes stop_codon:yes gene_type:complete